MSDRAVPAVTSEAEFSAAFHAYYAELCAFATRFTASTHASEELVQAVFVELWTKRYSIRLQTSLRAYLYASTRNRALDLSKHERVKERWAERSRAEHDVLAEPVRDAQESMEADERAAAVRRAIAELPERARLVVTLRWLRGFRPPEIAEALGISVKGVEIQITRALRTLRSSLDPRM